MKFHVPGHPGCSVIHHFVPMLIRTGLGGSGKPNEIFNDDDYVSIVIIVII
jgi:hypothetical protein